MTAALILTSASHTIACASCSAPWPREAAQCPGCGRIAVASITAQVAAPSPDDLRAQLAAVTAERDAAIARADADEGALRAVALWLGGPHQSPQPDDVAALARASGARFAALCAIVEGRAEPPTDAEIGAHSKAGGVFRYYDGESHSWVANLYELRMTLRERNGAPATWWAHDAQRRPCAWPTVPA